MRSAVHSPRDGHQSSTYEQSSNRLDAASGFEYDAAGNQTRAKRADGSFQRMTYDAANRLIEVRNDANSVVYESYKYGVGNRRIVSESGGMRTYYAGGGGQASVEYVEAINGGSLTWSKTFIYMGGSLLATISPNGASEYVEYHHPDRLGTRLTTNNLNASSYEQVTLPYGTALDAESTGATSRRFTSYDRSPSTGLDYAVNRTYDSAQGRFTQVDPIGMSAASLSDPQSLNLYAYCGNDPINHTDPDGLFFGKLFRGIGKFFKAVGKIFSAVGIAIAKVLNNRWVRIGVTIMSFLVPFLGPVLGAVVKTALNIYNRIADIASQLQLAGQLFQGKFKELGISIGIGLISSAISTIEDGIVQGVQSALSKNGKFSWGNFSFGKFFGGVWSGFKTGLAKAGHNLFGRGWQSLVPFYGNYCSPGNVGGSANPSPVDGVDSLCQSHDNVYQGIDTSKTRYQADKELFFGLLRAVPKLHVTDIAFGGRPSAGSVYKFLATPAFGGVIVYRNITGRGK